MQLTISNKLFKAIKGQDLHEDSQSYDDKFIYYNDVGQKTSVSYDTFYFDCKKWALNNGYDLIAATRFIDEEGKTLSFCDFFRRHSPGHTVYADNEHQVVINACEAIYLRIAK